MNTAGLEWRKSSRSNAENACVEVAWRKSSRSTAVGDCVEVAFGSEAVSVRDSKNVPGPHLTFPAVSWDSFRADLRGEQA